MRKSHSFSLLGQFNSQLGGIFTESGVLVKVLVEFVCDGRHYGEDHAHP